MEDTALAINVENPQTGTLVNQRFTEAGKLLDSLYDTAKQL